MIRSLLAMTIALAAPAATLLPAPAAYARAEGKLIIGSVAPQLPKATWVKGDPVATWEKGHIYVLDFWATWCGPCIRGIPHMNELAKKYKDKNVHVLGLAVWTRDGQKPTKDFVDAKGDAMSYAVAEEIGGTIADVFLEPAGVQGIPTVMVVDQQGKVVYLSTGPQPNLESTIEKMLAGTFDVTEAAASAKKQADHDTTSEKLWNEFQTLQMQGSDWPKMVEVSTKMLEHDPDRFAPAAMFKYYFLAVKMNEKEKAAEFGKQVVDKIYASNASGLADFAMLIASNKDMKDEDRDLVLAYAAATKANEISNSMDPKSMVALAKVESLRGNQGEAVKWQTKAIELVEDEGTKAQLREALKEFENSAPTKSPDAKE